MGSYWHPVGRERPGELAASYRAQDRPPQAQSPPQEMIQYKTSLLQRLKNPAVHWKLQNVLKCKDLSKRGEWSLLSYKCQKGMKKFFGMMNKFVILLVVLFHGYIHICQNISTSTVNIFSLRQLYFNRT